MNHILRSWIRIGRKRTAIRHACVDARGDNELFNSGPVDMSHKFDKMYVVRPKVHAYPLSSETGSKILDMRSKVVHQRSRHWCREFRKRSPCIQNAFGKNYETAKKYYEIAINDIDAAIKKLEKIKKSLTTSGEQLRHANNKTRT